MSYLSLWYCFVFVLYNITPLRALPLSGAVPSGGNSGKFFIDGEAPAQTPLFGWVWFDAGDTDNPNMVRLDQCILVLLRLHFLVQRLSTELFIFQKCHLSESVVPELLPLVHCCGPGKAVMNG